MGDEFRRTRCTTVRNMEPDGLRCVGTGKSAGLEPGGLLRLALSRRRARTPLQEGPCASFIHCLVWSPSPSFGM